MDFDPNCRHKQCINCGRLFNVRRQHAKTCSPRCRMMMMRLIKAEMKRVEALQRLKSLGFPV